MSNEDYTPEPEPVDELARCLFRYGEVIARGDIDIDRRNRFATELDFASKRLAWAIEFVARPES